MKRAIIALGIFLAICQESMAQSSVNNRDAVPNAATALKIGLAVLEARYGTKAVDEGQPYEAVPIDDEWLIVPYKQEPDTLGGGRPNLSLSKKDARVISISLSK